MTYPTRSPFARRRSSLFVARRTEAERKRTFWIAGTWGAVALLFLIAGWVIASAVAFAVALIVLAYVYRLPAFVALIVGLMALGIAYAMEAWNYLARRHDFSEVGFIEVFFATVVLGAAGTAWRGGALAQLRSKSD